MSTDDLTRLVGCASAAASHARGWWRRRRLRRLTADLAAIANEWARAEREEHA